ncbi:hypothetical protein ACGFYU_05075 [Streptomyces sp. NPDC048337]|uniref:hypothetical protein n=1 Tax=Streptomyces sp. NPDC048337 TaxID=3365535 RepID=UPI003721E794
MGGNGACSSGGTNAPGENGQPDGSGGGVASGILDPEAIGAAIGGDGGEGGTSNGEEGSAGDPGGDGGDGLFVVFW